MRKASAYATHGTGRNGKFAAGGFSEDRKGKATKTCWAFVADGERLAIALALEEKN